MTKKIKDKSSRKETDDLVKLHKAVSGLIQKNHFDHCFIVLISSLAQLLVSNFDEDEWEPILIRFSVDVKSLADLLHSAVGAKGQEAVH